MRPEDLGAGKRYRQTFVRIRGVVTVANAETQRIVIDNPIRRCTSTESCRRRLLEVVLLQPPAAMLVDLRALVGYLPRMSGLPSRAVLAQRLTEEGLTKQAAAWLCSCHAR